MKTSPHEMDAKLVADLCRTGQMFAAVPMVRSVAFSPDGKMLASCKDDAVYLFKIQTGQVVRQLEHHRFMQHVSDQRALAVVITPAMVTAYAQSLVSNLIVVKPSLHVKQN